MNTRYLESITEDREQSFYGEISDDEYNLAKENISKDIALILKNLHRRIKLHTRNAESGENSWEIKEFWRFAKEKTEEIVRLNGIVSKKRDAHYVIFPDEMPSIDEIAYINGMMEIYSDLLGTLLELEAHWQSSLELYGLYLGDSLDLSDYTKIYGRLTKPINSKLGWDWPGFRMADHHLMKGILSRLRWISDHWVHEDVIPIETYEDTIGDACDDYTDTEHVDADIGPRQKDEMFPTLSHSFEETKNSNKHKPIVENRTPSDVTKPDAHVEDLTSPSYRNVSSEPCPPGCLCYNCFVFNAEVFQSDSESSGADEQEPDSLKVGWDRLKKKKYKDGEDQDDDDEASSAEENELFREDEETFRLRMSDFEYTMTDVQTKCADSYMSMLFKYGYSRFQNFWIRIRPHRVHPAPTAPISVSEPRPQPITGVSVEEFESDPEIHQFLSTGARQVEHVAIDIDVNDS